MSKGAFAPLPRRQRRGPSRPEVVGPSSATVNGDFATAVLDIVAAIPPGKVMTYGDIAAALGSRAARQVGTILARSGGTVPWWRVIRASGRPAVGHEFRALELLRAEGTPLVGGADPDRVDLRAARHRP